MNTVPQRRMTRQRRTILEDLRRARTHPTADEIYVRVRAKLPRISLGTVYRNLQALAGDGLIRSFNDGSRTRYDGTLHTHYHVHCLACGRVADIPSEAAAEVSCRAAGISDFRIVGYKVEFVGICPECERSGKGEAIGGERLSDYRLVTEN